MSQKSPFRSLAHLEEQLGEELFELLIDPKNTGAVKELCRRLHETLPTTLAIRGRVYELVDLLKPGEEEIDGPIMIARAKAAGAYLNEVDGRDILSCRAAIPIPLRRKVSLVFPAWHHPDDTNGQRITYLIWNGGGGDGWGKEWVRIDCVKFGHKDLFLRFVRTCD